MPIIDLNNPSSGLLFCLFMLVCMAWSMWLGNFNEINNYGPIQVIPPAVVFLMFVVGMIVYLLQLVSIGFQHSTP